MVSFTVHHTHAVDAKTFWEKIFFDEEYNQKLYVGHLGIRAHKTLELNRFPDGTITRRVRTEPGKDVPELMSRLVGGALAYVETGTYDPKTERWEFVIVPNTLADRVRIWGCLSVVTLGPKKIDRVLDTSFNARIFGLGSLVEQYLERTTRASYENAGRFTDQFIRETGL